MNGNTITPEELRKKEQEGWEVFPTAEAVGFRPNWDDWYILRELVQNALDEHDEAGIKIAPGYGLDKMGNLIITDLGRGIGANALIKKVHKVELDLRGNFGEGLKLATMAALTRGYTLEIRSPRVIIMGRLFKRKLGGEEAQLLYFLFKENGYGQGTTVTIGGYKGGLYDDRFFGPPASKSLLPVVHTQANKVGRFDRKDAIIEGQFTNRLYVRDIYVRELDTKQKAKYSYNLWQVDLNPDRNAEISSASVTKGIANLWATVESAPLARRFITLTATRVSFESELDYSWGYSENWKRPIWTQAWKHVLGPKAILKTSDFYLTHAKAYGYNEINYYNGSIREIWRDNKIVPTDRDVIQLENITFDTGMKVLPDTRLSPQQLYHLQILRIIATRLNHEQQINGGLPNIHAAYIPSSPETGQERNGLFSGDNDIFIIPQALDKFSEALSVFYHELGHQQSRGAADGTREHVDGVTDIASKATKQILDMPTELILQKVIWW